MNIPARRHFRAGFTLIELLVVMSIIALLSAALIGPINQALLTAEKAADRATLHWHYAALTAYKNKHGSLPRGGGHQFVLAPWLRGTIEHTEGNRDRYFSKSVDWDEHVHQLKDVPVDDLWADAEAVSSRDTHFAGRAKHGRRHLRSGKEIWMATDNEDGNTYRDGSVLMLFGDNTVKECLRDPHQMRYGAPADHDEEYVMEVGPDSPHPDLRKLRKEP